MSLVLKNEFRGTFDFSDDIAILPSWKKCIWLLFQNAAKSRNYKVKLTLEEAKKIRDYLSDAITKVEEIRKARQGVGS